MSNRWVMCPGVGDNPGKPGLIPHTVMLTLVYMTKDFGCFRIGPSLISLLVG